MTQHVGNPKLIRAGLPQKVLKADVARRKMEDLEEIPLIVKEDHQGFCFEVGRRRTLRACGRCAVLAVFACVSFAALHPAPASVFS